MLLHQNQLVAVNPLVHTVTGPTIDLLPSNTMNTI